MAEKQNLLNTYIANHTDELTLDTLTTLLKLHGQSSTRLGRLLRDKRALSGDAADGISGAIAVALDELSTELQAAIPFVDHP